MSWKLGVQKLWSWSCDLGSWHTKLELQNQIFKLWRLKLQVLRWDCKFWDCNCKLSLWVCEIEIVIVCWVCKCVKFALVCCNMCLSKTNLKLLITNLTFKTFLKFHVKMQKIQNLLFFSILFYYIIKLHT